MAFNTLKNVVRQYLVSLHMFVDEDWLTGCVEYLSEENSGLNESNIKNLAREQWLLNDLKDICPGSLPAALKDQPKTVLNGKYVLQINAAVDIGTPAYQQYLKLQKVNMENVDATTKFEDKISSHRMIKLYLTDGVQEITAIEYKPMRNISCDITPGCKAVFKGPIECRRGMLLLTESTIELLGGEVQEIAVSNSLAGLISSKLGLPITQEPDPNTTISNPRNTSVPAPHTLMPSLETQDSRPVARVTSVQLSEFNDNDEDIIDLDQLESIEAQYMGNCKKTDTEVIGNARRQSSDVQIVGNTRKESSDVQTQIIDNNRMFSANTKIQNPNRFGSASCSSIRYEPDSTRYESIDNSSKRPVTDTLTNQSKKLKSDAIASNTATDYPDEDDLFFEDEDYLREMEAKFDATEHCNTRKTQKYSSEPFLYIKQINEMKDIDKAGRIFKVKAQIMTLLSKLSVGRDGWSLKCTLVDGTGSIDVYFTSDVLSELVGYTPQEMNQLKKQMASTPELKEKAVSALQKAKDTLQVLYCIIELTMLEVPKITRLTPFDSSHVELLDRRVSDWL